MYAPNKYYQPYTADSEGRSRRHSTSSNSVISNNNIHNNNKTRHGIPGSEETEAGGRGLCSLRCCCVGLALILVIGASVAGLTSWVLTREALSPGSHVTDTPRDNNLVNSDNLSDISPLLQSESDTFKLGIDNSDKSRRRQDNSVQSRINKESDFSTTTRKPSSPRTSPATMPTSHSTTTDRTTTYGPQYTKIISKMKEMRKQRLSNKYFSADESRIEDDVRDQTTEAMKETTTTTTKSPISTYATSSSEDKVKESTTTAPDISFETTTTEIKSPEELLKSSKFLRFQEEVLLNYTRNERNHKNNSTKDDYKEPNQIPETKDDKQVSSMNLDLSPKLSTSTTLTPSPSVTSSVTDEVTSSEKAFYAYPAIVTYTIDESTEAQGKIPNKMDNIYITCMMAANIAALYEW